MVDRYPWVDKHSSLNEWLRSGRVVQAKGTINSNSNLDIYCTAPEKYKCPYLLVRNTFRYCTRAPRDCDMQLIKERNGNNGIK